MFVEGELPRDDVEGGLGSASVALFDYLIVDEAHEIKKGKKLHWEFCQLEAAFGFRHKLLLTGTPIMNKVCFYLPLHFK